MKKILLLPFLMVSFISLLSMKGSGQLLVDDFNYSGNLTANGWTAHSGVGTNPIATTSPGLSYTGFPGDNVGNAALVKNTGGEDVNKKFTSQSTTGQNIYFSFLNNVNDASTSKSGDYLIHLGNNTSSDGATFTNFAARVFVRIVSDNVNFGLSNTSTPTWGTTNFSKNTTYLIVVKYTINSGGNDATSLYVFSSGIPASEAAAGTQEVINTTTLGTDAINAIALRQGSNTTQPQAIVDGIRVGTSFSEVTAAPSVSPSVTLSVSSNIATEAGPTAITITATSSQPVTGDQTVTLDISGTNITATDYTLSGTTITIPNGATTGSVTFTVLDDADAEGTETATLTISNPSAGITLGSTATQNITITDNDAAATTTSLTSFANPSTAGENVTFTATVTTASGTPTGTVTFFDGATNLGTATLSGNTATFSTTALAAGSHNITATYNGDVNNAASTSPAITQTVNAAPPTPGVVINEVYGGGGNSGATYRNDFIELYNNTGAAISLTGWSVQYASATGTTWQVTNLSGSIPANGYYLIQEAAGAGGTVNLSAPDATGTIAMSGTAGKIALVNSTTALSGTCPAGTSFIDFVGYGSTANCFEGTASAPAPSNTTSIQRTPEGTDNNQNSTDFTTGSPSPMNATGITDGTAPTITALSPADDATGVPTSFMATITFSESVLKGTGTVTLKRALDGSTVQTIDVTSSAVTVSGSNASFGINSLQFGVAYYFEISSGAFKDAANNNFAGIADPAIWNFTSSATAPVGVVGTTYNFNNCTSLNLPDGFMQYSVTGAIVWSCTKFGRTYTTDPSTDYAVQINGFSGGTNVPNVDWLISPAFDLTGTTYPLLSFWSRTAFNGEPLQLKVSTNYTGTGDPSLATWTDLNGKFPVQASDVWTESANINLSAFKAPNVYIAFVYESTDEEGARWTIDDFRIDNSATPPPPSITTSTTDVQFSYTAAGATSDKTFTFTGNDITSDVTLTSTGDFQLSKDGTTFSSSVTYTQAEANNITKTVYVRFAPAQNDQNQTGNITISTSGLNTIINLTGTSIDPVKTLEVVNWNIEWFSSPTLGPTNDALQEQNVKTILQNIGADIYGLTEVVDEAALATLVSQMPGYSYVISNYGSHTNSCAPSPSPLAEAQKLAFVYKTSVFSNVTTTALLTAYPDVNDCRNVGTASYNNWASGRYPFMMSADVTLNGITKNVKFILVHAKANTSPTDVSYDRRKAGAMSYMPYWKLQLLP